MTDYKFSKQIKRFSIILTIIGAIGIAFGFYNAPSNVEESKEIVAKMSHDEYGGDYGEGHGGGYGEDSHGASGHESTIMINMFSINYKISHGRQSMCQLYFS